MTFLGATVATDPIDAFKINIRLHIRYRELIGNWKSTKYECGFGVNKKKNKNKNKNIDTYV